MTFKDVYNLLRDIETLVGFSPKYLNFHCFVERIKDLSDYFELNNKKELTEKENLWFDLNEELEKLTFNDI